MTIMLASATDGGGGAGGVVAGFAIVIGAIILYWLPFLVGWIRGVPNLGSVAVIDGLLGWTAIGWVVALAMACRSRGNAEAAPARGLRRRLSDWLNNRA
jgi:hypothetical protein